MNKVLVLAPHPDDETLGCGGTLLRHKKDGDEIHWLIGTILKEDSGFTKKRVRQRQLEIEKVAKMYGFNDVYDLGLPTMKVDSFPMELIITKITEVINKAKPNILYLPFKGDIHSDHRVLFNAAFSCTKIFRHPFIKKILMMEVISETEFAPNLSEHAFTPNYFVNITDFWELKIKIMKLYRGEMSNHPFPRSIENIKALAMFRGAQAGVKYAESFMLLKEIV